MIGGIEKSSESDSAGVSDVNKSISVTGAPSICDTTQIQTKKMRTTEILSLGNEEESPLSIHNMDIDVTILQEKLAGKSSLAQHRPNQF